MSTESKTTVVIIDDSSVIRSALAKIIDTDPNIEIIGSGANGSIAISMARTKQPDIMLLDVEMPVMDGLTAIPGILESSPSTKIIMCSSLTAKGADTSIRAMSLGAVDCLVKPSSAQETGPDSEFHKNLLELVKTLGGLSSTDSTKPTKRFFQSQGQNTTPSPVENLEALEKDYTLKDEKLVYKGKPHIVAIGSSTGGPQALFTVLKSVGKIDLPIVITQHMPATFTKILADHIKQQANIPAHEGEDGMLVEPGHVYVAPGDRHMLFEQDSAQLKIKLDDGPQENFCKPAVDPMLRSLIEIFDQKILCTILTGMGHDGLLGARTLSEKGGRVIAQDKKTSVVWGMPGAVAMDGICSAILPLDDIGAAIKKAVQ